MPPIRYESLALYIDGQFLGADHRFTSEVINPATGQCLGQLPHATRADLDAALAAGQRAFGQWRQTSAMERSRVLRAAATYLLEHEESIAVNLTLDQGKPLAESRAEIRASREHLEWHAEECRRIYGRLVPARSAQVQQRIEKEPVGLCAAFTPWNFPLSQAVRKVAAALGAGCSIILKGPENTPSAIIALARALEAAGLPAGCFNAVWGVPDEVSRHLLDSPLVRAVSFTGSVSVGKVLAARAAAQLQRITLELGGHAPVIVFEDADVEQTASVLAQAKFRNAGQVCIAPSRFYVHERVFDRFAATFTALAGELAVGNGMDPATRMGPLAHPRRVAAMQSFCADAVEQGAKILAGGRQPDGPGYFHQPTVLFNPPPHSRLLREEPFGPLAPLMPWKDFDAMMQLANGLPFGLAAYAFTGSARHAARVSAALQVGQVSINHAGLALAELPMGGVGESGYGAEGGTETFEGYLNTKVVTHLQ